MIQRRWQASIVVGCTLLMVASCAPQESPAPHTAAQMEQTIPPNSPFAKVQEGMGAAEVKAILGEPTDIETMVTGKMFIPFYMGADRMLSRLYYKGLGQVYVSGHGLVGKSERVVKIEYNPQESGYRK